MPLTKKELKAIEEIINRRMITFTHEALGEKALTEEEINMLKRAGLIRSNVKNMSADPFILGKIVSLLDEREDITYKNVLNASRKIPLTNVEEKAIQFAQEHAGTYIKGLRDDMLKDVSAITTRMSGEALRSLREGVAESLSSRETRSELATRLFNMFDDRYRDWRRVAHTEINNAVQQGIYHEIIEKSDADQLVFKRPSPDACNHCKRVYLKEDGVTPKVFKISQLQETNVGLKARDWGPTIGAVHPWCSCQLHVVPDGFDFVINEDGVAILSYTGTTAEPVRKSEILKSLIDDDCVCDHG